MAGKTGPRQAHPLERELPWLQAPLADALRHQRGHAVLVHGPAGIGQFDFALAMAQAWLCEGAASARPQGNLACGQCVSCHLWRNRSHPDALVLMPAALAESIGWLGDTDGTDAGNPAEGGESRSRAKPSSEIKVEAIRQALAFAQQTGSRGVAKVVVVYPAEQMNAIAANTLLKTLEEPPGQARFVLASAQADALLPTVRSRCQSVALRPPPADAALAWLEGQGLADAATLLAAASGQALAALELAAMGLDAASWARLPRQIAAGDSGPHQAWPLPMLVSTLLKLCTDAMRAAAGRMPQYFPAHSLPPGIETADLARLSAWAAELRRFALRADHPLNASLQAEALLARARAAVGR